MKNKLYKLIKELGLRVVVDPTLPPEWNGAFNAAEGTIEISPSLRSNKNFVLLHEACHALQFFNSVPLWDYFQETGDASELERDCEQRAIGWLYLNGLSSHIENYVQSANDNLSNYDLEI